MPQISTHSFTASSHSVQWMIWEITEELSFFQNFPECWSRITLEEVKAHQKVIESTAARFCLWQLCQNTSKGPWDLRKDERNRPFLDGSDFHISLSHSYPFVAAAICEGHPIGIDLERLGRNIEKIAPRFLSAHEWDRWQNSPTQLTKAWTCKEAVYKAMGIPGLSFQQDIHLPQFDSNSFDIHVKEKKIWIQIEEFDQFTCSIAIEN